VSAILLDPPPSASLPGLRQELRIEPGAPLVNGAPSWTLFDPVRHVFFQLGRIEFRIFSRWAAGSFDGLDDALKSEGLDDAETGAAIHNVIEFSLANHLTVAPMGDAVETFAQERARARSSWWKWLVDHYLFFRLPLVRPAAFLERTVDRVAPLYSVKAHAAFAILALVGLFLVSRQWDAFMASFLYFFSWQGLIAYGFGLSAVKVLHELGHAWTATRYGCRVASMGVSFLVMFPVLYTDTTSAWRLTSRRKRLAIDCAGVAAELMVASISTLIWVMLPEGSLRSIFFILAASSWIMSLAVNLNPLMRFDGYYVLADWLDVPNLQARAFALGRWRMRELLFGLGEAAPEDVPVRLRRTMVVYAWCTWIYRLILFTGIALLVYHLFFKLLGIILFMVEIGVFVARPIFNEFKAWHDRRSAIWQSRRGKFWLAGLAGLALFAVLPLDRHVSAPAILAPIAAAPIVAGDPSRVDKVHVTNGQRVRAGDILFELSAPELEAGQTRNSVRIAELEAQIARAPGDREDLANRGVLERQLATERANAAGVSRRQDRLFLRAPVSGLVTDLPPDVHPGRWLGGEEVLARVVTPGRYDIQAYVPEDDAWRIDDAASGVFVPDDITQPSREGRIVERAAAALQFLDQPSLASINGGAIAVNEDASKRLRPRAALYRMRFVARVDNSLQRDLPQPLRGEMVITARSTSFLGGVTRFFTRVLRREASVN
jgi:putative peptide zinc metalloprotease protein